jgi:lipid-binding SYLF domain-containing protein
MKWIRSTASVTSIRRLRAAVGLLTLAVVSGHVPLATASDQVDARHLVDKSKITFDRFVRNPDMEAFRDLMKKAKGVFIAPEVIKGAFFIGGSGGNGVFLARNPKGGWNGPAFYTLGSVNFGLQFGGKAEEVVLLAMTERGLTAMLSPNFKLGADAGISAGPVGVGAAAATANLSADMLSFTMSKGAFVGIALDGAVVAVRESLNTAHFGKPVTPSDILVRGGMSSKQAAPLVGAVAKAGGGK